MLGDSMLADGPPCRASVMFPPSQGSRLISRKSSLLRALSSRPLLCADTSDNVNPPPPINDASPDSLLERLAQMQGQLDTLRSQLHESQRLATIGTIAAVIAHEFNNLLTPIVSYSQYALSSAQSAAPDMELVRKALGKAYQSSSKAGKICSSMLGLARGESSFGPVEVRRLVEETLGVLRATRKRMASPCACRSRRG